MRKRQLASLVICAGLGFLRLASAWGWGEDGHRIVCEIAWRELELAAKAEVIRLLQIDGQFQFFSDSCNWADEIKSNGVWNWARSLHYVNLPKPVGSEPIRYDEERDCRPKDDCPEGMPCPSRNCVVAAITYYHDVLANPSASDDDKLVALKFMGHFVGDLHQPLHAGYGEDKGGNDRRVEFFGKKTNLHSVWDSGILLRTGERWLEYARGLGDAISSDQRQQWRNLRRAEDWTNESHRAVLGVYAGVPATGRIGQAYFDEQRPVVEEQLKKGGVRLAMLLNDAFRPSAGADTGERSPFTGASTNANALVPSAAPAGKLEVHVIDVGQGDAILIRCPDGNHEMLIDAGDNRYPGSGTQLKEYLTARQDRNNEIEVVVASHPHADHIGNMAWVLRNYRVGLYVDNGETSDTTTYRGVETAWEQNGARYWSAQDDAPPDIDFCPRADVSAVVLRPNGFGHDPDPNNNSVVVRVEYAQDSFLFVGDTEKEGEQLLASDPTTRALLDVDFLKAGHHGSDTSSTEAFLELVSPEFVAVSCGAKGVGTNARYKHPRLERIQGMLAHTGPRSGSPVTVEAFDSQTETWKSVALNKAVFVTTAEGSLVFESNGHGVRKR